MFCRDKNDRCHEGYTQKIVYSKRWLVARRCSCSFYLQDTWLFHRHRTCTSSYVYIMAFVRVATNFENPFGSTFSQVSLITMSRRAKSDANTSVDAGWKRKEARNTVARTVAYKGEEGKERNPCAFVRRGESLSLSLCACTWSANVVSRYTTLSTLEVQLCTCFVPSCNYLQVTYLKGRLESASLLRQGGTCTRYVSVPSSCEFPSRLQLCL